jgi:peptidoglycan hydrolase CwlO-like protein
MAKGVSLPKIQTGLDKLEAQLSEMHAEVKRVGEQIRSNRGEITTRFESSKQDSHAKHTAVKTELSSMRGDINSMRTDVSVKMNSLEKRLMGLEESEEPREKPQGSLRIRPRDTSPTC